MSAWFVEDGIGEERALLFENGEPVAAAVRWPGGLEAGAIVEGKLISRAKGTARGMANFPSGEAAWVDRLPREASEGTTMRFVVTREAVGEANRRKPAQVRPANEALRDCRSLAECLPDARIVRSFPGGAWESVCEIASEGSSSFPGGSVQFFPTPAMTVVDVDGHLSPRDLSMACVQPLVRAIRLLGLGGIVGVDFPTLEAKADRKQIDAALRDALADFDHERTAMNGFGFVQIVSRMERPSLLHRWQFDRAGAAARTLLRQAERLDGAGRIECAAHPAVIAKLTDGWLGELARRSGREVAIRPDPALALEAPHAQLVPR